MSKSKLLKIENYSVKLLTHGNKQIAKNVELTINEGEMFVLTGANGVGKSSFVMSLLGLNDYERDGSVMFNGKETIGLETNEIAKLGMFLSFQSPPEFAGIPLITYLISAYKAFNSNARNISNFKIRKMIMKYCQLIRFSNELLERSLNEGFSGGERRKCELLQMLLFYPKLAILDEVDSGLDIESKNLIVKVLQDLQNGKYIDNEINSHRPGFLIISHSPEFVKSLKPTSIIKLENQRLVEA